MHLAEVLALRREAVLMGATFVGMPPFPRRRTPRSPTPSSARTWPTRPRTIRDKRAHVVGEVDDWEALRGKAARSRTRRWPTSTSTWCGWRSRSPPRGAVVHWARDAAEACAIIAEIARDHDATRS